MTSRHEEIKARLLATFALEAQEHLQALTAHLQALDRGLPPDEARAVVEATFREMHTLKGAARAVSLMDVEALCQGMETVEQPTKLRVLWGESPLPSIAWFGRL